MKKLLAFAALLGSVTFFAACDDEEEAADIAAPAINVTAPAGKAALVKIGGAIAYNATIIDDRGLTEVKLTVKNSAGVALTTQTVTTFPDPKSFTAAGNIPIAANVPAGEYKLEMTAKDAAGNEAELYEATLMLNPIGDGPASCVAAGKVTVVVGTPTNKTVTPNDVHIVGSFPAPNDWKPELAANKMTRVTPNCFCIAVDMPNNTEFKFARGSWDFVEKQADGVAEVDNRKYETTQGRLISIQIANWRDCGEDKPSCVQ